VVLHEEVKDRLDEIKEIVITTHESAIRIIDKTGPLYNPADRDHCLQYITAIALIKGHVTAEDYEDDVAKEPIIDQLREKMIVQENLQYTKDYLDPMKRSIANAVQVTFHDGSKTDNVVFEYPLGHRFRREEAFTKIIDKFTANLSTQFSAKQVDEIEAASLDLEHLPNIAVNEWTDLFVL